MLHSEGGSDFKCNDEKCAAHAAQRKLTVDVETLNRTLYVDEMYWDAINGILESNGVETMTVPYRDLCQKPEVLMPEIFKFIGVPPLADLVVNATQKMDTGTLRKTINNDDEVAQLLKGTPYEGQLDEVDSCR